MKMQPNVWEEQTSPPHLRGLRFTLSCVQSCQVNHEGTVRHVSKSRINVMIWPLRYEMRSCANCFASSRFLQTSSPVIG